jgi:hypothetical protein
MPTTSDVPRRPPPQQSAAPNPNHEFVSEWSLPGAELTPADRDHDHLDNPDLSANNQLGAQ